ncbi:MAG: helix-turn-helix transcriptional regulator [Clostridia bacterium]|nr:helix-turn-helix transcriptional regulator [Clostridia bacterium]
MDDFTISVGYIDYAQMPMRTFHQHTRDELMLVERGRSTIIVEHRVIQVDAPFVVFYPHDLPHQQINDPQIGYSRYLVNYHRSNAERLLSAQMIPMGFFVLPLSEASTALLLRYMKMLLEEEPAETCQLRRTHLTAILLTELAPMLRTGTPQLIPRTGEAVVNEICMYISRHYSEPLQLHDLARRFFISRSKLIRIFPAVLGMTVGDYITGVRIAYAKHCLKSGMSVQETASACGFSDAGYFIKVFRRETGMTPAAYKKQPAP